MKRISNLNAGISFDAYKFEDLDPDNPKNEFADIFNEFTDRISEVVAKRGRQAPTNKVQATRNKGLNKLEGSAKSKI